ncbi:hypothetical protein MBBTH_14860 [Methanobrevibacter thaueri]|uniref:Uncharacterized protein n=1 Tax=Methanobrevibacter thaueri TaxID=190975 RepID=A0A315XMA7_9EURY|nr:hypothetical protein MBBTH_14860 [Methanobrevibacter thaueri]
MIYIIQTIEFMAFAMIQILNDIHNIIHPLNYL